MSAIVEPHVRRWRVTNITRWRKQACFVAAVWNCSKGKLLM